MAVLTGPREVFRKQLRKSALEINKAGFSETNLSAAWREMINRDIAARIVRYFLEAAIGDSLLPWG